MPSEKSLKGKRKVVVCNQIAQLFLILSKESGVGILKMFGTNVDDPAYIIMYNYYFERCLFLSPDIWEIMCNSFFYSVSNFPQTASGASLAYRHCICTNITFYCMLAELMPCLSCGPKRNSSVKKRYFRLKSQGMLQLRFSLE